MLDKIVSPADLRALSIQETEALAKEIRQAIIDAVAHTGGHLASNLGAVEITLAMHRVFHAPEDKIVFDVGHQSYTHKLLTGRQAMLSTLRAEGGISGFPKRGESQYDAFETGHASTAISAALGMARARDARGERHSVVALVGDGALTGGMCYEALNDAGSRRTPLIILLNDNEMSIAHNVGALSAYLTKLRGSKRWLGVKEAVKKGLIRIPLIGAWLISAMDRLKRMVKHLLIPSEFFEALGLVYLGPIDGHDIPMLERALRDARTMSMPVVVHAVTQKGRGYGLAERKPEQFHGTPPFFVESGKAKKTAKGNQLSASQVVEETLVDIGAKDPRVFAITAAMKQGTGLSAFAREYAERFFDVGIAEEHAVTMAAGMASGGMRPIVAIYASFLQRAVDQLLHDVCLQKLPVLLLVDHAGFVSGDGATHQGVYDLTMLRAMPGLTLWTPCDARELRAMIRAALELDGPCVIRYPKTLPERQGEEAPAGRWRSVEPGGGITLLGYGHSILAAREAAGLLRASGVDCSVWSASCIMPLDEAWLDQLAESSPLAIIEEGQESGGLGEAIAGYIKRKNKGNALLVIGVPSIAPGAHSLDGLAEECGMSPQRIAARIEEALHAK